MKVYSHSLCEPFPLCCLHVPFRVCLHACALRYEGPEGFCVSPEHAMTTLCVINFNEKAKHYYTARFQENHSFQLLQEDAG